nr:putative reverse transcriptase domain-containing protein [Tanacetum cinerariifolium]
MIHGSVVASKPKTMQEAIEIETELMDKKVRTFAERETASKRKFENTSRTTRNQQQQQHLNKRNVANTNNANNHRGTGSGHKLGCYECGVQGHFRRECPKLKNNNNHGNQGGRNNAPARVYAVGRAGTYPDANVELHVKSPKPPIQHRSNVRRASTTKEVEDKSKEKRVEDVPIVRDFPEVFPEDFPGLPPI